MNSSPLYRQLREKLAAALQFLPDKPEETPDSTVRALWHRAMGRRLSAELATTEELAELTVAQSKELEDLVRRRIEGAPLSHLTERQHFMGLEMLAGPGALVPRSETQLLASVAIGLARSMSADGRGLLLIDVCTGCGNVALAIARHVPAVSGFAADLSGDAVALALRNASHLNLSSRIEFRTGDLLKPFDSPEFEGKVDLLTCNPPYISSAKIKQMPSEISRHEPSLAFDGGPFGISVLMQLLNEAPRFLRSGGWLAFEVGLGQGPALSKRLLSNSSFEDVRAHQDLHGDIRTISARRT